MAPQEQPIAECAVTRLIQGIYDREPTQARRIVRHRIHSSRTEPTEMGRGMVQVAAKRMVCGVRPEDHPLAQGQSLVELEAWVPPPQARPDLDASASALMTEPMELALQLAAQVPVQSVRSLSDRRIAAVLTDAKGKILDWAVNASSTNKTLHAEVNLVQGFCRRTGSRLPEGSRLFTALKSCRMCAAMIWSAAQDPRSLRVYFAENDPGPKARHTALELAGVEFGPDWRRFCYAIGG